jgi:hypothetical protein
VLQRGATTKITGSRVRPSPRGQGGGDGSGTRASMRAAASRRHNGRPRSECTKSSRPSCRCIPRWRGRRSTPRDTPWIQRFLGAPGRIRTSDPQVRSPKAEGLRRGLLTPIFLHVMPRVRPDTALEVSPKQDVCPGRGRPIGVPSILFRVRLMSVRIRCDRPARFAVQVFEQHELVVSFVDDAHVIVLLIEYDDFTSLDRLQQIEPRMFCERKALFPWSL